MLEKAVSLHRSGNKDQAKELYEEILAKNNHEPDANHNLGLILWEQADSRRALHHVTQAITSQPMAGAYWKSKCQMLMALKAYPKLITTLTDLIDVTRLEASDSSLNGVLVDLLKSLSKSLTDGELLKIINIGSKDH